MTWRRFVRVARLRWRGVTQPTALDAELDRELAFHQDQLIGEHVAAGLAPEDAVRAARRAMGNVTAAKEYARDTRRLGWLEDLRQDLRYAARTLRTRLRFSSVAIASLAVGLAANAAVLSAISTALWRPLPLAHADRLVIVRLQSQVDGREHDQSSLTELSAWRAESQSFQAIEASVGGDRDVSADRWNHPAARIATRAVTPGWFELFGVTPYRGRLFHSDEYVRPDDAEVMVISFQFWRDTYGLDPRVFEQPIRVNGFPTRIVGVMPPDFAYQSRLVAAWFPLRMDPAKTMGSTRWFNVVALRRPDVSLAETQADVERISRTVAPLLPPNLNWRPHVVSLRDAERGWAKRPLWGLEMAAALLLLVCGANVAGLITSRNMTRGHELAMRAALGAGRSRLVRQMFAEAALLTAIAAAVAIPLGLVTLWVVRMVLSPPIGMPPVILGTVDWGFVGFVSALAFDVTLLIGAATSWASIRPSLVRTPRPDTGMRHSRTSLAGWLVAIQTGVSIILLTTAILVAQSFLRLSQRDLGFDQRHLLLFQARVVGPSPSEAIRGIYDAVSHVPGAEAAGGASDWWFTTLILPRATIRLDEGLPEPNIQPRYIVVTPGFFAAMRAPVVQGREFGARDTSFTPWTVLVNEETARQLWPAGRAVNQMLTLDGSGERPREVIGVVGNMPLHREDLHATPMVFVSFSQLPPYQRPAIGVGPAGRMAIVVRYATNPGAVVREAQACTARIAPDVPLIYSGEAGNLGLPLVEFGNYAAALIGLSLLAIALVMIGLYSTTSALVTQLTRDISLCVALGATRRHVLRRTGGPMFRIALIGGGIGITGALVLPSLIASKLWNVNPRGPGTLLSALGIVTITIIVACWPPLRRGWHVNPARVLRTD